jgi:hypothetical protein
MSTPIDADAVTVSEYGHDHYVLKCGGCGRETPSHYSTPHTVEDCLFALAERVRALEARLEALKPTQ